MKHVYFSMVGPSQNVHIRDLLHDMARHEQNLTRIERTGPDDQLENIGLVRMKTERNPRLAETQRDRKKKLLHYASPSDNGALE